MEYLKVSESTLTLHFPAESYQGNAFRDLKDVKVYPSVGMKRPHAHLSVNFGQRPFMFDIDRMVSVRTNLMLPVWIRRSQTTARETKYYRRNQRRRRFQSASYFQ